MPKMTLLDALAIVHYLASDNVAPDDMESEHARQTQALDLVRSHIESIRDGTPSVPQWRVRLGYRLDDNSPLHAHELTVTVGARDYDSARLEGVAAIYNRVHHSRHVRVLDCVLVESETEQATAQRRAIALACELEATHLRGNQYAVRPRGQLGTCGWSPIAWQVEYVSAPSESAAIRKASRAAIFGPR
jgi:hypothetical protein